MSKTGQCGLNPSESSSLRSLKIACRAPKMSRVTSKMVLFCLNAFSKSHGRSSDRTTVHFKHYWWWATILRDVTDRWLVFGHARSFLAWHDRSFPAFGLHALTCGRSTPRCCLISDPHDRSPWGTTVHFRVCLHCLARWVARLVHRRDFLVCRICTVVHMAAWPCQTPRSVFFHRIFAASSFCPESPRFWYHLVWYAVLGL